MSLYNKYRPRRSFGHPAALGADRCRHRHFAIGWRDRDQLRDLVTGFNDVLCRCSIRCCILNSSPRKPGFHQHLADPDPCTDNPPPQTPPNPAGCMIISETCAARGETIGVQGLNYPPLTPR